METYCDDPDNKEPSLNLIIHVEVEYSHNSDANALIPPIESTKTKKEIGINILAWSDRRPPKSIAIPI